MSTKIPELLGRAALGAVLITVLMLPFRALTPFAPYVPLLIIVPILLFFALQAPPKALLGMFVSFACGVGWAALFLLVASALPGGPLPVLMNVGVALVIFLVLAVRPLLGRTPLGVVPAVLLGFVEALLVAAAMPMLMPGAPQLNLLWLIGIFAYGCVMTLILVVVENAVLGRRGAFPAGDDGRSVTRGEAHR